MIKLVCADPFLHDLQKKQNQHLNINYDMASTAEHKAIFNMPSELGVEISYSSAHQISKFVNIFYIVSFSCSKIPYFFMSLSIPSTVLVNRGTQRQFSENICSVDDLRSRISGTFVIKFLACLPLLGSSNI